MSVSGWSVQAGAQVGLHLCSCLEPTRQLPNGDQGVSLVTIRCEPSFKEWATWPHMRVCYKDEGETEKQQRETSATSKQQAAATHESV